MHHVVFIQMGYLGKRIQRDVLVIIGLHILLQLDTFPAGLHGGNEFKGKVRPAYQLNDQHVEQILAHKLIVGPFILHLLQQGIHKVGKFLMITSAVENKVLMLPAEGKIQAFNTKDNVFQRNLPPQTALCGRYWN